MVFDIIPFGKFLVQLEEEGISVRSTAKETAISCANSAVVGRKASVLTSLCIFFKPTFFFSSFIWMLYTVCNNILIYLYGGTRIYCRRIM